MILLLSLIVFFILFIFWGAGGIKRPGSGHGKILKPAKPQNLSTPQILRVMSWNIGYGQGLGSEGGELYQKKTPEEFKTCINQMGEFIASMKPDIILLQEVDLNSSRSSHFNQLDIIREHLPEFYVAYCLNWDANYVPFPYWPPSKHFGQVRAAGAILSRYPITEESFELLPKPEDNPWVYNLFYLFRYFQKVKIEIGKSTYSLFNMHLEAFDQNNRNVQTKILKQTLEADMKKEKLLLVGGDLNSVPHYARVKDGFTDYPKDRYTKDNTLMQMESLQGMKNALPESIYKTYEATHFTFPSDVPDRRLDHLFVNERTEVVSLSVLKNAGVLSDHLPIFMELRLNANQWP